jgi:hypothetical protein
VSENRLHLTKYKGFLSYPAESNALTTRVRDILLQREAQCLLDRISYKLELSARYGADEQDYVNSLRELAAALEKTLRFDAGGCL